MILTWHMIANKVDHVSFYPSNILFPSTHITKKTTPTMKNASFLFAASLIFILGIQASLCGQKTTTWQGGKPGRTTDWNCPANWSEGHVPDEFTQVIIPTGANCYPVIQSAALPIDALLIEAGARLSIQAGATLCILGETGIFDGVTFLGHIENNGTLEIGETVDISIALMKHVRGAGMVVHPSTGTDTLARRR